MIELKRFDVVGKYSDEETMYEFRPDGVCYDADEVDAAIEELKQKLDKTIAERDGNQVCIDALKQKLEDAKATAYAEMVDAGMRERRLKRALYKACANWMTNRQVAMACYHLEARAKKFDKAIDKCRSMAEEYK